MKFNHALAASLIISFLISLIVFANTGEKNKVEKYYGFSEDVGLKEVTWRYYVMYEESDLLTKKTEVFNYEMAMTEGLKSFGYIGLGLTILSTVGFGITHLLKRKGK